MKIFQLIKFELKFVNSLHVLLFTIMDRNNGTGWFYYVSFQMEN